MRRLSDETTTLHLKTAQKKTEKLYGRPVTNLGRVWKTKSHIAEILEPGCLVSKNFDHIVFSHEFQHVQLVWSLYSCCDWSIKFEASF